MVAFVKKTVGAVCGSRVIKHIIEDLTSLRSTWNYVYLILYTFVCIVLLYKCPEACGNTIVVTTGGIVVSIFTGYVFTKPSSVKPSSVEVVQPKFDSSSHPDGQ